MLFKLHTPKSACSLCALASTSIQFMKGKGFLVCDVRVVAHTQNCPKNGLLKARLMAWAAKLREKISQLTSTKQYLVLYFFAFQTIISRFRKHLVERNIFGKEVSDVVVRKMYVCSGGFVLPALKKVGTEFSQKTDVSDSDDDSSYSANNCHSNFGKFVHVQIAYGTSKGGQENNQGWKALGSPRIGSSLTDKVTKSYFD